LLSEIAVKYESAPAEQFIQLPFKNKSQETSPFEKMLAEKEAVSDQNRKTDSLKKQALVEKTSAEENTVANEKNRSVESGKAVTTGSEAKEAKEAEKAKEAKEAEKADRGTAEVISSGKKPVKKAVENRDKENTPGSEKKLSENAAGSSAPDVNTNPSAIASGNIQAGVLENEKPQASANTASGALSSNTDKKIYGKAELLSAIGIKPENTTEIIALDIKGKSAAKEEKAESKNTKSSKKEKKEFFDIIDLRKGIKEKTAAEKNEAGSLKDENGFDKKFSENRDNSSIRALQDGSLKELPQAGRAIGESGTAAKGHTLFQSQLLESLKESGNKDIVKNASLILKDNNSGEIKLLMKPEHLGYVRIKLTVEDNNIAGKIIVDNINTKELFESNIENLIKSFRESGYSSAMLDVSVGGRNERRSSSENEKALARKEFEKIEEHTVRRLGSLEESLIDMVV
jgi:flagellar hook-length control protein FliK